MSRPFDYFYILATICLTAYGQLIIKWRIAHFGSLPDEFKYKLRFILGLLFDPVILSGFAAALFASLTWMAAMTKFELSHAYPFMSLNFVVVMLFSSWLLNEPVTMQKMVGVGLIVFGTMVAARG